MKSFLLSFILLLGINFSFGQTSYKEYVTLRVQYGNSIAGYKYEIYLDIGTSGSHSMSGQVTNVDEHVIISDDYGKQVFESDMDLLNYLGKKGWVVISTGEIDILDQHYYTYLLEREVIK